MTSDDNLLSGISGLPLIPFPVSVCPVILVLMVHSPAVFTENSSVNVWVLLLFLGDRLFCLVFYVVLVKHLGDGSC